MHSDGPAQSPCPPPPAGREIILLSISEDFVRATAAHHAKLRTLGYDTAAARFNVLQCGPPTAHDVSSYIIMQ